MFLDWNMFMILRNQKVIEKILQDIFQKKAPIFIILRILQLWVVKLIQVKYVLCGVLQVIFKYVWYY